MVGSHQVIGLGTLPNDGTGDYPRLAGQKINTNFESLFAGRVSVKDPMFGATGDGVTDDLAAIQAAIDWAYTNGIATVHMPAGHYKITDVLWLDAPDNGRTHWSNPPNAQFSLRLVGEGWGGGDGHGTYIEKTDNGTALVVGPGQYMGVKGVSITGSPISWRSQLGDGGAAGILIMGAGGGAHATNIEDCQIAYFPDAISVGMNLGTMGDSNTIVRCQIAMCNYGFHMYGSQNFINAVYDCTFQNCKRAIYSNYNQFVNVVGGNISTWGACVNECVHFSTISGWESEPPNNQGHFRIQLDSIESGYPWQVIKDCDCFCMEHPDMGFISFKKVAWNDISHILTLELDMKSAGADLLWWQIMYGSPNWLVDFLNGSPTPYLYAGECTIAFGTCGIHAKGVHFESAGNVVKIVDAQAGWNLGDEIKLEDCYLNWLVGGLSPQMSKTSREYAYGALCLVSPIVEATMGVVIEQTNITGLWRVIANQNSLYINRKFDDYNGWWKQPINGISGKRDDDLEQPGEPDYGMWLETPMRGFGFWDKKPNRIKFDPIGEYFQRLDPQISRSPYFGYFPVPWSVPRMTPDMLDRYMGPLPDMFSNEDILRDVAWPKRYAPVCGDCIYQVTHLTKDQEGDSRALFVRFKHAGWSWGRDLPNMTWEMPSKDMGVLRFGGEGTKYLFSGLVVILSFGGELGDRKYMLTEVINEGAGGTLWRVASFEYWPGGGYSGTGVKQQPFKVTRIGNQRADALTDTSVAGHRYEVGEQIWRKSPGAGGLSMGWVCTVAGKAGSGACFNEMAVLATLLQGSLVTTESPDTMNFDGTVT